MILGIILWLQSVATPTSSKPFYQQDSQVETTAVFEAANEVSSFSVKVMKPFLNVYVMLRSNVWL